MHNLSQFMSSTFDSHLYMDLPVFTILLAKEDYDTIE